MDVTQVMGIWERTETTHIRGPNMFNIRVSSDGPCPETVGIRVASHEQCAHPVRGFEIAK